VLVNIVTKKRHNTFRGSGSAFYNEQQSAARKQLREANRELRDPDFARKETAWGFGGPVRKIIRSSSPPETCCAPTSRSTGAARSRDAAVHQLHERQPSEQHLDPGDEHVCLVVHRRPEFPDGRPALGSSAQAPRRSRRR